MNIKFLSLQLLAAGILLGSCNKAVRMEQNVSLEPLSDFSNPIYDFKPNGKKIDSKEQDDLYVHQAISADHFPALDAKTIHAIQQQMKLLKRKKRNTPQTVGNLTISNEQLIKTADILLSASEKEIHLLAHQLDAFKIKGDDGHGNVYMTGYYTPVLEVSRTKTEEFPYPIYAYPQNWNGSLPTRAEIDGQRLLAGKGLELAYAKSLLSIYDMQLQGSGIVQYRDGSQELFAYTGTNKKSYKSIGTYMLNEGLTTPEHVSMSYIKKYLAEHPAQQNEILFSNPSYVFFHPEDSKPKGAGIVPLTEGHSVAVDTRYIPMGSILLASVPVVDKKNNVIRHEYQLLVAQDVGGAIKGTGHLDLYTGVGYKARNAARRLHHFGNVWLLLPGAAANPLALK